MFDEIIKKRNKRVFQRDITDKIFSNDSFQRVLIALITVAAVFFIIANGAAPKRYKVKLGEKSSYDINAPRDIENKIKTEENASKLAAEIPPVVKEIKGANAQMINKVYELFDQLEKMRFMYNSDTSSIEEIRKNKDFSEITQILEDKQLEYILKEATNSQIKNLKNVLTKKIIPNLTSKDIYKDSLEEEITSAKKILVNENLKLNVLIIGKKMLEKVILPNSMIDLEATKREKENKIEQYKKENPVIIHKDERIVSIGDIVTKDKLDVLKRLNLIDSGDKIDYPFLISVLTIILLLTFVLILYMRKFTPKIFQNRNDLLLLSVVVLITILIAWAVKELLPAEWSSYLTFIFIAPVLISIFLDLKLAIFTNVVLTICISLMVKENITFIMMSIINGSIAAYITTNASQRRKISLAGLIIGFLNIVVILCMDIFQRKDFHDFINEGELVFINGLFSVVLAIGLLPFLESTFNIITPLKLLELADPNHPLIKKMLMEAPGTYHHSLMVGNLAEVATRAIGGNALLARVGAYFHDIGKLKRPNFFRENQMSENPHDRMTPNLSTLVITSHTKDGEKLALKNKIPKAIRDIIVQHHGDTLVAYFYHKACKSEKAENIKEEDFRYEGPKPDTKEAAVVLLADSVEAAVRSMPDKTKGKIEGLIRKIIKDKLEDGQLDKCDLTLKDLSDIADSFLAVLSGFFHERLEYPELEKEEKLLQIDNKEYTFKEEKIEDNKSNNGEFKEDKKV